MTDLVKSRRAFLLGSLLAGVACLASADEALAAVRPHRRSVPPGAAGRDTVRIDRRFVKTRKGRGEASQGFDFAPTGT